ncbi:vacuolar protein sorting-associated protein 26C-like [Tubulanus polymorphus]|uniref:vacuolar protein sorting-associated protein 26C-like n=1 Tax=Tubulanus polymorphus TaxID=672921 RepID=UPI003DA5B410
MSNAALDIRLKKVNKIYHEGEILTGFVVITSKGELQHQGITLTVDGKVDLQLSAKSVGLFEAFYNSLKPIQLMIVNMEIAKPGRLPSGRTEIPFEIPVKGKTGRKLYETYHGVFVNIQYLIRVDMKRSLLNKDLQKQCEFIVEMNDAEGQEKAVSKPLQFNITPSTLQNVKDKYNIPRFKVTGKLDATICKINEPFTGDLVVESCEAPIKSVELQLVRVETCGCAEGYAKDSTEIQNIQIAEGDVCRNLTIPIYMIFPRLFTSPTLHTPNFKVEFECNIVIVFHDDHLITENFPIKITRF